MARDAHLLAAMAYDGMSTFELGIVSEVFGLARPEPASLGTGWPSLH